MSSFIFLSVLFLILQCPLPSLSISEGDALTAFKNRLSDPNDVLRSWADPDPCTWVHVKCDASSHSVISLDLAYHTLVGTLAPELGQLPNLQNLTLFGNYLTGKIPAELGNLKNLINMDLSQNLLEGNIPKSFGKLKSLKFLGVSQNHKLAGIIPIEVIRLNLQVFDYHDTLLSKPPVAVMASLIHSGRKVLRITNSTTKRSELKELVPHETSDSKEVIFT